MLLSPLSAQSHYKYLTASHHDHDDESLTMKMVNEKDDGENIADSDGGDEHEDVNHIKGHGDGDYNENHMI